MFVTVKCFLLDLAREQCLKPGGKQTILMEAVFNVYFTTTWQGLPLLSDGEF